MKKKRKENLLIFQPRWLRNRVQKPKHFYALLLKKETRITKNDLPEVYAQTNCITRSNSFNPNTL